MDRDRRRLTAALVSSSLVIAIAATSQGVAQPPPDAGVKDVRVVNGVAQPLPVELQGGASISGEVTIAGTPTVNAQQSGPWAVDLSDEVVDVDLSGNPTVEAEQSGEWDVDVVGGVESMPPIATEAFVEEISTDFVVHRNLPGRINASLITVSAENDEATVRFRLGPDITVLKIGSGGDELPAVTVIPLPQRLTMDAFTIGCFNEVENCEITLSIIGD